MKDGWEWEGGWQILKNSSTDSEGWKYAKSFKSVFKKDSDPFDTVRQRFWHRKCYKIIEE